MILYETQVRKNNMICFEKHDEHDEIHFEVDDEVHILILDLEVLKICLVECEVNQVEVNLLIWRIYFEVECEDDFDDNKILGEKNQKSQKI
jgi:hypothetical protein